MEELADQPPAILSMELDTKEAANTPETTQIATEESPVEGQTGETLQSPSETQNQQDNPKEVLENAKQPFPSLQFMQLALYDFVTELD